MLCAANKVEPSYYYEVNSYNKATNYWLQGIGWQITENKAGSLRADADGNNKVTLNELYTYAYPWILNDRPGSHSVVYPENDPMVIFGRY